MVVQVPAAGAGDAARPRRGARRRAARSPGSREATATAARRPGATRLRRRPRSTRSRPAPVTTPPIAPAPTTTTPPVTTTDEGQTSSDDGCGRGAGDDAHRHRRSSQPEALSYTIAADDGSLAAIHSRQPPSVGKAVEVEARAARQRHLRRGRQARARARPAAGRARRHGQLPRPGDRRLHRLRHPVSRCWSAAAPQRTPPEIGERVEVEARIADDPEPLADSAPGEEGCGGTAGRAEAAAP